MSPTWYSQDAPPVALRIGAAGWTRILLKGSALALLILTGLVVMFSLRLLEWSVHRPRRAWSATVPVWVSRAALRIIGLSVRRAGDIAPQASAIVANHASWLDIFVLNAGGPLFFVSKSEVAGWPGIGWLARASGTVFIERTRTRAVEQAAHIRDHLATRGRLLFFPEGTSTDGLRVLPFRTTLFASFYPPDTGRTVSVQPVSIAYHAPEGRDARFYGWWGDMEFGAHLLCVLAAPRQGHVDVVAHPCVPVAACATRKDLARACETAVRAGHASRRHVDARQGW